MITAEIQALQALADRHDGRITPDIVLAAARSPDSPLHARFEWDDSVAAERHRLAQARSLIRSVRIEFRTDTRSVVAPYFLRDPDVGSAQGYRTTARIATDEDAARASVIAEFRAVASALTRARMVASALGLAEEIDGLIEQVGLFRDRIASHDAT